jgi:hypothetical protein
MRRFAFPFVAASFVAHALAAQPAGVTRQHAARTTPSLVLMDSARSSHGGRIVLRALGGGLGMVGAALAAVAVVDAFGPYHCGCDDPGLAQGLVALLVGGVGGTALGASIPKLGSTCTFGERLGLAAVGTIGGFLAGAAASTLVSSETAKGTLILAGGPVGAALGQWQCSGS